MRDVSVGELLLDEAQAVLVAHAEDDGVRLGRHGPGLAGRMHELRAHVAKRHVRADEAVVSEGVGRGAEVNDGWS